ncbi:MAG: hypothetical protein ABSD48_03565 [Armatimonadota bacterium]|jgi:hypothetical protein
MAPTTRKTGSPAKIKLRSFREGDEIAIAQLFAAYVADFVGPSPVTPQSWRRYYRRQTWSGPSVQDDPDCARLALMGSRVVGYAVTDYKPEFEDDNAAVQELCVERGPNADAIAQALLVDSEQRARTRGKQAILLSLPVEDAIAMRAARALGFRSSGDGGAVFMAAIVDLSRFLTEIAPELTRRVSASEFAQWSGMIAIESGQMTSGLKLTKGRAQIAPARSASIRAAIHPEALPPVLLGQLRVSEAFLQNRLAVTASDRMQALKLLDVLFPRAPMFLPKMQWW